MAWWNGESWWKIGPNMRGLILRLVPNKWMENSQHMTEILITQILRRCGEEAGLITTVSYIPYVLCIFLTINESLVEHILVNNRK